MYKKFDFSTTRREKLNLLSKMATGSQDFDLSPCFGTDVPGCHSSEDGRATSSSDNAFVLNVNASILQIGRDNALNVRSVDDRSPSENRSEVESGDECHGPVLREHWKPRGLLSVGRSRLGFPDCDNDHLVQLLVCKNQHTRELLDIAGHYDVTVAVSYEGASGSSLQLPDYQCKRIKIKSESGANGSMIGVIGYLFRFHEPVTKYKITFCLNAISPKRKEKKRSLKEHAACETICQISVTLETGPPRSFKSSKTKKKAKESTASPLFALSPPSLSKESTAVYESSWWVFDQLRSCRANAKWEDFDKRACDLLLKFTDADTKIAIKLEQGLKVYYYQGQSDLALQLIDEAFKFVPEAKNPQLMAGRGYFYQAQILLRQGSLGKAEHCVKLAWQNFATCQTGLETSLIAYLRASMLVHFMGRTSHRSLKLVNEALKKFIDVYLHVEKEKSYLFVMKHLIVIILNFMTMLLLDCESDAARNRNISEEFFSKAQWCLDTLRNKYWSEMTQGDRVFFFLGSSDMEYRRSNYADAEEFARLAKDKAMEVGFNLEACKAQERIDFMRAITGGHIVNNGPEQSESEGGNADISSSGEESDWLTALLN